MLTKRFLSTILESLLSGSVDDSNRLKTENGSSALDEGKMFKINHRFSGLDSSDQLVFKINLGSDIEVISRHIDLWEGGLEYFAILDEGQYPDVDALLANSAIIYPMNPKIGTPSLSTGSYGVLSGTDVITIADDDQFSITDLCMTGSSNSASSSDSTDDTLSVQPSGASFYLVFNHLGANNQSSSGHYELIFKELT